MKVVNCDRGLHDFDSSATFHVFSDEGVVDGHGVEIKVWCKNCGGVFEFIGMKPIVHREKPGSDEMATMAYLPIKYAGKHEHAMRHGYGQAYH